MHQKEEREEIIQALRKFKSVVGKAVNDLFNYDAGLGQRRGDKFDTVPASDFGTDFWRALKIEGIRLDSTIQSKTPTALDGDVKNQIAQYIAGIFGVVRQDRSDKTVGEVYDALSSAYLKIDLVGLILKIRRRTAGELYLLMTDDEIAASSSTTC